MLEFQINFRQWLNFYLTYFSKRQFLFVYGILVKIFVEKKINEIYVHATSKKFRQNGNLK